MPCNVFQGLLPEKKIFEVHIEKGHKHNAKVVLRGEAGYSEPGIQPGDVIFVLEQKPHKTFKRIQADLVIERVLLLLPIDLCMKSMQYCISVMQLYASKAATSNFLLIPRFASLSTLQ